MTENTWALTPEEFAATKDRAEAINARAVKRGFTGRIEVTATIKTHEDYQGVKQTALVRPKLTDKKTPEGSA